MDIFLLRCILSFVLSMDRISTVLSRVLSRRGLSQEAQASLVVHRAREWITLHAPSLVGGVYVERIVGEDLLLSFDHSLFAQEAQAFLPSLLAFLRSECGFQ